MVSILRTKKVYASHASQSSIDHSMPADAVAAARCVVDHFQTLCDNKADSLCLDERHDVPIVGRPGRSEMKRLLLIRGLLLLLADSCDALRLPVIDRRMMLGRISFASWTAVALTLTNSGSVAALALSQNAPTVSQARSSIAQNPSASVAYKSLQVPIDEFGVNVPIACWFPSNEDDPKANVPPTNYDTVSYEHRISVRRIGQLLAGWNFIPDLVSRKFSLRPSSPTVTNGDSLSLPVSSPVVLLAHGYLGSRFDMSHLAEKLASEGFVCMAAEYPESLAASFDRVEGLTRQTINHKLLDMMQNDWKLKPPSFGIVGHSLGCGTAIETGDESWARVCIAGFPRRRDGSSIEGDMLFLTSMNDGAVSLSRLGGKGAIPSDFVVLEESSLQSVIQNGLPKRAALVYDRPDAPNHISFLSEGVNDAMIDLLSPLLPVAQSFKIPVLDFDRYQISRDSIATARAYHPLVIAYLKQQMAM